MGRSIGPALLLATAALVGCGGDRPAGPGPVAEAAAPLVTIDPATTSSVSGTITYAGPDPVPASIDRSADPACEKGDTGGAYVPDLVVGPDHALANAVVWIKDGAPAGRYEVPEQPAVLEQRGCWYSPRVQALLLGQKLEIRNADATMHNVHVLAQANREWNRSQIQGGIPIVETFKKEEIPVTFKCNVHPWMKAQVAVVRHPFFAVTGPDGRFEIAGVPAGEYTIGIWHETLGTVERKLTLVAKEPATVDVTMAPGA